MINKKRSKRKFILFKIRSSNTQEGIISHSKQHHALTKLQLFDGSTLSADLLDEAMFSHSWKSYSKVQ